MYSGVTHRWIKIQSASPQDFQSASANIYMYVIFTYFLVFTKNNTHFISGNLRDIKKNQTSKSNGYGVKHLSRPFPLSPQK